VPHAADGEPAPPGGGPGDERAASKAGARREVLVTAWPGGTPDPDAPRRRGPRAADPAMPRQIGRFRLLRPLGSGGMSVVYEAYDDRLERTVALKLLREKGGRRRQARLQREAQALARLSHPNVVEVYETGSHEGRAFLVMERLPGQPLQRWLAAAPRSVQAVIDTFVQAGQGLRAAHAQGLVHRDFKPSNVLVDADGRVRVFDFGLAAPSGPPSEDSVGTGPHPLASGPHSVGTGPHSLGTGPHAAAGLHPVIADLDVQGEHLDEIWEGALTRTGAVLGTPAYMSPEQYEGRPATAQSDQFAFCVALYEALWREHPFVEREQWELLPKHVMEGRLREPSHRRGVPAAVRRVIERGLAVRPKERWPSMDALLVALRRATGQRRRGAMAAGVVMASAAVAGLVLGLGRQPAEAGLCTGASDKLAEVWGAEPHDRVRAALLATGVPYAESAWREVEGALDAYAEEWVAAHRRACEGLAGEHAVARDAAMDGRMACLERRRRELGALVEVLAAADPGVVQHAVAAVSQLEASRSCDAPAIAAVPSDPTLAARIEREREVLRRARALERAGRYRAGLELVRPVTAAADAIGYATLRAEAQLAAGRLHRYLGEHDEAERALERAYFLAQEVEHDALALEAVTLLAYVVSSLQRRPDDAFRWLDAARAAAERVGGDRARGDYLDTEGTVLWAARRRDDALDRFQQALPLLEKEWGPEHPEVAKVLNNTGLLLLDLDRPALALDYIRRSLAIRQAALGSKHPEVGKMLNNQGLALRQAGHMDEAVASFERAHALRLEVLGPDHPDVAKPLANLAAVELERGQLDRAAGYAEQALAIRARAHGEGSVEAAQMHAALGRIRLAQARPDEAVASLTRAVLAIEQALGPEHVELVEPLVELAEAEHRAGRRTQALGHAERALALGAAAGLEPWELARGRLVIAQVEWDLGDSSRARVQAELARNAYATLPAARRRRVASSIAALEVWWAEHGAP
jgi:eukaryotic-like serine/threonine-protein kinase